jgi:1-acyl-sn-glycerol-3-phosphate acyltransferase
MIALLRSLCFHAAFFVVTVFMAFVALPALAGPPSWSRKLGWVWSRAVLWLNRWLVGLDYRLEGDLPSGPTIIASKHQSAFETFLFPALCADSTFVIKKELLRVPLVGWYLARAGQIAVDRSAGGKAVRHMLSLAKARTDQGLRLVIFPEGTRVAPGESAPLRPGISALYSYVGLPVVPVTLDSGTYWPRNSLVRKPGTITVRFGTAIQPGLKRHAFEAALAEALSEGATENTDSSAVSKGA